jgi:D-alanyl-D-alanine carboxypeptidase
MNKHRKLNQKMFSKGQRIAFGVALLLVLAFAVTAIVNTEMQPVPQQVEKKLSKLLAQYQIPGAVLAYKIGDEKTQTVAVGDASVLPVRNMSSDALFLLGSISKSFTSVLVMKMIERGKFTLHTTLGEFAKKYKGDIRKLVKQYPSLAPMDVRELLNHTSGVPQSINTNAFKEAFAHNTDQHFSSADLMSIAMQHKVYFKPGSKGKWSYTNTDYLLLGLIVEDSSGKPLNQNFTQLIAETQISNLYFSNNGIISPAVKKNMAIGYMRADTKGLMASAFHGNPVVRVAGVKMRQILPGSFNIFSPAASGVIATAPAAVAWYRTLFFSPLLTSKSLNALTTPVPNGKYNHAGYALGVTVHTYPGVGTVISHDGLSPGYSTVVMYFKRYQLIIAVMTNSSNDKVSTFNVHTGAITPGIVTNLLPIILKGHVHV